MLLQTVAGANNYSPANAAAYNNGFRNPVFSFLGLGRLPILYSHGGLGALRKEPGPSAHARRDLAEPYRFRLQRE